MAYNEAISETNNQQILKIVVQDRYEERGNLLAVSSVTANVKISSRASVQAGFGSIDNYQGNLVPFSGGFIYEENPTISYAPVAGANYLRQVMAPGPGADGSGQSLNRALPLVAGLIRTRGFTHHAH